MATPPPQHKNKPQVTHISTKPKVVPNADDGKRYMVIDTKNRERAPFGTDLPHKAAKLLASKLSATHKCRTAKVEPMPPPTDAQSAKQKLAAAPAVSTGKPSGPPTGILSGAQIVAQKQAAEAQKRHEQHKKDVAERQRVAELAAKAKSAGIEDDGEGEDVDVDALLGAPTDDEVAAAGDGEEPSEIDPVTGRPPIPSDAPPAS